VTSSKIERLIESLDEAAADGHKSLVFSQWTSFLDLVEPHMEKAGIGFVRQAVPAAWVAPGLPAAAAMSA